MRDCEQYYRLFQSVFRAFFTVFDQCDDLLILENLQQSTDQFVITREGQVSSRFLVLETVLRGPFIRFIGDFTFCLPDESGGKNVQFSSW